MDKPASSFEDHVKVLKGLEEFIKANIPTDGTQNVVVNALMGFHIVFMGHDIELTADFCKTIHVFKEAAYEKILQEMANKFDITTDDIN